MVRSQSRDKESGMEKRLALVALLLVPLLAAGDAQARRGGSGNRIECSSLQGRFTYCPTYAIGAVRLEQQLSRTPCRQYQTWGSNGDGSGVWVSNGCRGVFVVGRGGRPGPGPGRTITCTSNNFSFARCDVPVWGRRVFVQRQLSRVRCIQGNNWGTDWRGIWVDRGCNAVFAIE
jgi:hypothetical protein